MKMSSLTRIAIVNGDRCKPNKCNQECKKYCPVNRMGKICIEVTQYSPISIISEPLCIGCGICVKKCPFDAINIINIPTNLDKDTTHRYGPNSFKLHRLPIPHSGQVLGIIGTNGIGKSTALNILSGKLKPNLGNFQNPPSWADIIRNFRGSGLQNYFKKILENNLKSIIKDQYIQVLPRVVQGKVGEILAKNNETDNFDAVVDNFDLQGLLERNMDELSGGELQRFACAYTCLKQSDVYMFDEPSSYLDIKQRVKMGIAIRNLVKDDKYVVVVEHDLSVLDFMSDYICTLYGSPTHYGVATLPSSTAEGINNFMEGYIPTENMRFRETNLSFRTVERVEEEDEEVKRLYHYKYPAMKKTLGSFCLDVAEGTFSDSEINVLLGENGNGKTTFIKLLAGKLEPDGDVKLPNLNVSYKPQIISPKFEGSVAQLLQARIPEASVHQQFIHDVMKPLNIQDIQDQMVKNLSGGELQRIAITICLGKPADVYLIDEPSAYLDSEQRLRAAKIIKRFIRNSKKTAFIVEHDFIMATYLADRCIVFEGQKSVHTTANAPESLLTGMNRFLKSLQVTIRRDRNNSRPRINRLGSARDTEQKRNGTYFFLE